MEVVETHWILAPTRIVRCRILSEAHLQHFERKIRESVGPMDYVTNVRGQMTDWRQFNDDPIFHEYLLMLAERFQASGALNERAFRGIDVKDSWGNVLKANETVVEHDHCGGTIDYASVIYFDDSEIVVGGSTFCNRRGHVITLPGHVLHSVGPSEKEERITLAFNWSMILNPDKWDEVKWDEPK
tara:strand:- start:238 stop:792 length:555 start_codon:yes stop_codon:yes gene_type:complete